MPSSAATDRPSGVGAPSKAQLALVELASSVEISDGDDRTDVHDRVPRTHLDARAPTGSTRDDSHLGRDPDRPVATGPERAGNRPDELTTGGYRSPLSTIIKDIASDSCPLTWRTRWATAELKSARTPARKAPPPQASAPPCGRHHALAPAGHDRCSRPKAQVSACSRSSSLRPLCTRPLGAGENTNAIGPALRSRRLRAGRRASRRPSGRLLPLGPIRSRTVVYVRGSVTPEGARESERRAKTLCAAGARPFLHRAGMRSPPPAARRGGSLPDSRCDDAGGTAGSGCSPTSRRGA